MKILPKILLPVLLATSIGLFVSIIYTYEMSIDALTESSSSLQKMAITDALVELKTNLDSNLLNTRSLAQTGILQPYLSKDLQLRLVYAADIKERITNLCKTYHYVTTGILDNDGIVINSTDQKLIGQSLKNEPFFHQAMAGDVAISAPYKYNDKIVYTIASPIYKKNTQETIGVVFNVALLTDTMSERMLLGEHGYLFVADKWGTVFIHKDHSKVLEASLHDNDWGAEILSKKEGSITFSDNGREKIAYYDSLPESGWVIVAVKDLDELAAPGRAIGQNAAAIGVIIIIVLTMIISLYVKHIVDALLKAVRYAEQVSQGVLDKDLDLGYIQETKPKLTTKVWQMIFGSNIKDNKPEQIHRIQNLNEIKRNDEIGTLYESLQTMVKSMRLMVKKADDSNRMKSEFLANMSHEIRTPLNAIIGLAHLWLNNNDNEQKKHDYIVKIETAGKSLLGIINNVLDTSKIEANMFELEELHFSLRDVGEQVLTIYQDIAKEKNLELSFNMHPDMHNYYWGDPVRIGQILNNFVGNAIKFTEKGFVRIDCSICKDLEEYIHILSDTVPIRITVSDSGIGFSKEQEESLFKPFAQADASITRRFGGTGLGLAISKHIIELMHGQLFVKSIVNKGTTFTMFICLPPSEESNAININQENFDELNLKDKRILVVEDNEINQLIMEELLQKTNAQITIAENGQVAVDLVSRHTYDIIFMDMQMPIMDGIQATKIIREKHSKDSLPIIAITANAMKEDKEKGFEVGLNDYLTKPVDPPNLMMTLRSWLLPHPKK